MSLTLMSLDLGTVRDLIPTKPGHTAGLLFWSPSDRAGVRSGACDDPDAPKVNPLAVGLTR
jgi:hypothetical protein